MSAVCYPLHVLRGLIAAAVLCAMSAPGLLALHAATHVCTEHVCACRAPHAPSRPAPRACHGPERSSPSDCDLRSRCGHELPALTSGAVYLTSAAATAAPAVVIEALASPRPQPTRAGIRPIEPPPPKAA